MVSTVWGAGSQRLNGLRDDDSNHDVGGWGCGPQWRAGAARGLYRGMNGGERYRALRERGST
eukprot:9454157-Pyramimonas_sp.AAC.1